MVRVLLASGVFPDFVVGASVGTINAAYFACAPDLDGVAALERIWVGIRRADIFPFQPGEPLRPHQTSGEHCRPRRLAPRDRGQSAVRTHRGDQKSSPHHGDKSPRTGGSPLRRPRGRGDPGEFRNTGRVSPVEIDGDFLMDGAVAANTPVRLAAELGASRIIILPTGYACALPEPPRTVIGKALHAITLMIAWQLMHELEVIPREIEVHLVPTLCPLAISPLDFSASRQLIERAAESSRKWIKSGGLTRSASPQELAPHRH